MNVLDLFSGIGGFSLGLERAGMRTVAFCEIDPYCRRVLAKHWPDVPVYGDVRAFNGVPADVICGGFPCQDISVAGKGAGIGGERSGLWSEYARIIGEVRPRYVIVENVAALLGRGLERVLGDLAALGFDAEWHCIPASAVGAPHRRDRVWIVAHAQRGELRDEPGRGNGARGAGAAEPADHGAQWDVADAAGTRPQVWGGIGSRIWEQLAAVERGRFSDAAGAGWNGARPERSAAAAGPGSFREPSRSDWWLSEPDVGRVAHGVPARVDRLRALGNSIVPQIAEIIGRAIMSIEREDYDGNDDFTRSIGEAYRVIRERKKNGGKGWGGWE
jgi:DNA (cytosine-5)-methyltransferase 1